MRCYTAFCYKFATNSIFLEIVFHFYKLNLKQKKMKVAIVEQAELWDKSSCECSMKEISRWTS